MRITTWKAVPAVAVLCIGLAPMTILAQEPAKKPAHDSTIWAELAAAATPAALGASDGAAGAASGASAASASADGAASTTTTTAGSSNVAAPVDSKQLMDEMAKEMQEMKTRMALMESALKAREEADSPAAEQQASALRAAEGGSVAASIGAVGQAAAAPAPAAAPTPPEISAETTTKSAPFAFADWTWLNDGGHNVDSPMSTKYFTPEIRFDANYILDYNHPVDDSMVGSTEMYRSDEFQLEQASFGGDFRIQNTRGRILTMNGLFSQATVRNDASYNRGQWNLADAYKYFSEAWGGYHWDVGHGLNVDAGIFVSYVGLFSYYNFDNWTYQPSFVSSNTPWFFNGLRIQYFVTDKLKIEPWIINGWQSYARYNGHGGLGGQVLWRPNGKWHFNFNDYGLGEDDAGFPGRSRVHADYSLQNKLYDNPKNFVDKFAWTLTGDAGCEYGGGPVSFATSNGALNKNGLSPMTGTTDTYNGGVDCHGSKGTGRPKQMFLGWMAYTRLWLDHDRHAFTLGGGQMNNPGRYLTLVPAINGATATSGTPYFTENAGDRAQMHDMTFTYDYMPSQFITFRLEQAYRYSDVPYWTGRGGVTPPGGNNGSPSQYACSSGAPSGDGYGTPLAQVNADCGGPFSWTSTTSPTNAIWWPDLRTNQSSTMGAIMVRF